MTMKKISVFKYWGYCRTKTGERHRLIGLNNWGVIAEIWRHTDKENPSDEDDIVRLRMILEGEKPILFYFSQAI